MNLTQRTLTFLVLTLFAMPALGVGKTNVILIMADDIGYECYGAYGGTSYQTINPNITKNEMAKSTSKLPTEAHGMINLGK